MNSDQDLSLGQYLRRERETKGISIEQVASATRINVKMLHHLEEDDFRELPAKPFVRGFVTSYARFVGIEPQEILMRFRGYLEENSEMRPSREQGHTGYVFEKKNRESSRKVLWGVMGACIVLGALIILVVKPALKHQKQTREERIQEIYAKVGTNAASATTSATGEATAETPGEATGDPKSTDETVAASDNAENSEVKSASTTEGTKTSGDTNTTPQQAAANTSQENAPTENPAKNQRAQASETEAQSNAVAENETTAEEDSEEDSDDPLNSGKDMKPADIRHRAVFKALANVWIRYQSDQRPVMQFMLKEGGVLVLRAKDVMKFQASNAKAIQFAYNGLGYQPMGNARSFALRQNTPTFIVPRQAFENTMEPFPGRDPLPPTPDPQIRPASEAQ